MNQKDSDTATASAATAVSSPSTDFTTKIKVGQEEVDVLTPETVEDRVYFAQMFLLELLCHDEGEHDDKFTYLWALSSDKQKKITIPFRVGDLALNDKIARQAIELNDKGYHIFVGVNLTDSPVNETKRAKKEDITMQTAIVTDIDVANGLWHTGEKYPADIETAMRFLPFKPSLIVSTGAGLHAYTIFDKPLLLSTNDERETATARNKDYIEMIRERAGKFAGVVDSVQDLTRVLRVPGTYNWKGGKENAPMCGQAVAGPIKHFSLDELRDLIKPKVTPPVREAKTPPKTVESSTTTGNSEKSKANFDLNHFSDSADYDSARAMAMIGKIDVSQLSYSEWLAFMSACKNLGIDYSIVDAKNAQDSARYNERENLTRWQSLTDPAFDISTLHGLAKRFGYVEGDFKREWHKAHPDVQQPGNDSGNSGKKSNSRQLSKEEKFALFSLPHTDLFNASRLSMWYGKEIRFVRDTKEWYRYFSVEEWGVWQNVGKENSAIYPLARDLAHTIYANVDEQDTTDTDEKLAKMWQKRKTLSNAIELLKGEHTILIWERKLNTHKHLLNCMNGTIDLRTGKLFPHDHRNLLTQVVPVKYDENCRDETLEKFLRDILPDDDTRAELLRYLGYCLTGETREDKALFIHGDGGNGKGTLTKMLLKLFGDYACGLPIETVLAQTHGKDADTATPAFNKLIWRRLAIAEEIPSGRKLDYAKFKILTGGDALPIRRLYQEATEIENPTHKMIFSGNHLPELDDTHDPGIRRRWLQIKFDQDFNDEKRRDAQLKEKLQTPNALSALLTILVREAVAWYKDGLIESEKMKKMRENYFSANDFVAEFINEYCTRGEDHSVKRKDFLERLRKEYPLATRGKSDSALTSIVAKQPGIQYKMGTGGRYTFYGVSLIPTQIPPDLLQ